MIPCSLLQKNPIIRSIITRCHGLEAFKSPIEISEGSKTYFIANLFNRFFIIDQKLAGFANSKFIEKMRKSLIGTVLKKAAKSWRSHKSNSGNFFQGNQSTIVDANIVDYFL